MSSRFRRRTALALTLGLLAACSEGAPPAPPLPLDLAAELEQLEAARTSGARADRPVATDAQGEGAGETISVGARLIDASFRPLAGGTLAWCEADPQGLPIERGQARADANGTLWLTLPLASLEGAGPLFLASAPGCARKLLGTGPARLAERLLNLGEVQLGPAGELTGTVRDAAGRPLADARVWLGQRPAEGAPAEPELERLYPDLEPLDGWHVARSDAQGVFRLTNVPPGTFDLLALPSPAGARLVPATGRATIEEGTSAQAGELVLLEPRPGELLRGLVRGVSGAPRAHARLLLVPADGRALPRLVGGTAGADGRFELLVPEESTWVVEARDAQGELAPVRSEVVGGGDELELVLGD